MAGGSGTRLWPLSRRNEPKQFQKLVSEKTMLQETIERLSFQKPEDIFVATIAPYLDLVKEQTFNLIPVENIIVEPALRDTCPAIGFIASHLAQIDPDDVMSIIYADHLIQDTAEMASKLQVAAKMAQQQGTINIIEVKANYPNTSLGYVKIGKQVDEIDGIPVHSFEKFVEKPDLETAKKFIKLNSYLWNTGLYVWKISTILEAFEQYQPETAAILHQINQSRNLPHFPQIVAELYPRCQKISIDFAIMEKLNPDRVRIIPADLGWNDIGIWSEIWKELATEEQNNVLKGQVIPVQSKNCLIYSHGKKVIATLGIEDLVVVDTPDALLVCPRQRANDLKILIEKVQELRSDLL